MHTVCNVFKLAANPDWNEPGFKWKTLIGQFDDLNALDCLERNLGYIKWVNHVSVKAGSN